MFMIKLQENHCGTAFTFQRVITKGVKNSCTPLIKTAIKMVLLAGDGTVQMLVNFMFPGIKTAVADHFKEFLRDMAN